MRVSLLLEHTRVMRQNFKFLSREIPSEFSTRFCKRKRHSGTISTDAFHIHKKGKAFRDRTCPL